MVEVRVVCDRCGKEITFEKKKMFTVCSTHTSTDEYTVVERDNFSLYVPIPQAIDFGRKLLQEIGYSVSGEVYVCSDNPVSVIFEIWTQGKSSKYVWLVFSRRKFSVIYQGNKLTFPRHYIATSRYLHFNIGKPGFLRACTMIALLLQGGSDSVLSFMTHRKGGTLRYSYERNEWYQRMIEWYKDFVNYTQVQQLPE